MSSNTVVAMEPLDSGFDPRVVPTTDPKRRLLVVDDDDGPRQSLRVIFREQYEVLLAESGLRALEIAQEFPVHAAVVDIRMAGMSGIEVLDQLKSMNPDIEVVMLTAYETLETARQALRLGACEYLTKPFDLNGIREAVAKAMERCCLTSEIRANGQKLLELQGEIQNQRLKEEIARARGEIYASIVHDINGPLTIISGFIEAISQRIGSTSRVDGENLAVIKDRLARITRQVNNCIDISRRYLSFLRQQSVAKLHIRANQVLTDLDELLKAHPSLGANQLVIRRLPEDVNLNLNGTDLIQILLNLTVNALQATPEPHRVEVSCQRTAPVPNSNDLAGGANDRWVDFDQFTHPTAVVFRVEDSGSGIPAAVLSQLFVPYFTTKTDGKGTGLGLSIVHRLVKQSGGAIHIQTECGVGTTFEVYLPPGQSV